MRNVLLASCLVLAGLLAGCFEMKQVFTVNPDGSAKVVFENIMAAPPNLNQDEEKPDVTAMAKQALSGMVSQSKGIDAWSDLSCDMQDDGRVRIKGVAYVPDIGKVKLGGATEGGSKWAKNDKGGMTLDFAFKDKKAATQPKQMTDEEVAQQVKKARAQWQQAKPMMAAFLATMKVDTTYVLPGKLEEVEGFTKTDKGGVQVVLEGQKMLDAMEKVMADDKLMAAAVKAGRDPVKDGPEEQAMLEAIFGRKISGFKASVSGELKPQFDYKAEMEKAKAGQDAMMKKLGIDPKASPKMPMPAAD